MKFMICDLIYKIYDLMKFNDLIYEIYDFINL